MTDRKTARALWKQVRRDERPSWDRFNKMTPEAQRLLFELAPKGK